MGVFRVMTGDLLCRLDLYSSNGYMPKKQKVKKKTQGHRHSDNFIRFRFIRLISIGSLVVAGGSFDTTPINTHIYTSQPVDLFHGVC